MARSNRAAPLPIGRDGLQKQRHLLEWRNRI
nr:MAG TPA: hypothetical protein [Caudoviricetes sp.]